MKKLNIVLSATVALSCLSYAGGDILPTVFESEEVYVPVEEVYTPAPEPEYVEEQEFVAEPEYVDAQEASVDELEYVDSQEEYVDNQEEFIAEPEYVTTAVVPAPLPTPTPTPVIPDPTPIVPLLAASAPLGLYGGLGFTLGQYKVASSSVKDRTAGVIARLGYDFNDYIGVEARGIRTNWKPHGGKIKHAGIFLKPMYPVTNDIDVYGLAGYAKTTTQGVLPRVDENAFAWGAGMEYDLSSLFSGLGLFGDYERLVQKSGSADLDTLNFGLKYNF